MAIFTGKLSLIALDTNYCFGVGGQRMVRAGAGAIDVTGRNHCDIAKAGGIVAGCAGGRQCGDRR